MARRLENGEGPRPNGYGPMASVQVPGKPTSGHPGGVRGSIDPDAPRSGDESWQAFAIADGIDLKPSAGFQLAPRAYILGPAEDAGESARGAEGPVPPSGLQLQFRESERVDAEGSRQAWAASGEDGSAWELVVEQGGAAVRATLTATSPGRAAAAVWSRTGGWEPFGPNGLDPEPGSSARMALRVVAP